MEKLTVAALIARRKYYREYNAIRRRDPEKIKHDKEYLKQWKQRNPEKVKNYLVTFWEKRAGEVVVTDNVMDNSNATDNCNKTTYAVCGTQFTPRRKGAKYCSQACKQKHYRLKTL
jgi:hypothetical protein